MSRRGLRPLPGREPATGFTLLELLVVIAVMGLIAGLGFPAIDRSLKGQALRTAVMQIEMAVRETRADALRKHRTVELPSFRSTDYPNKGNLTLNRPADKLQIRQPVPMRFFGDGSATGGRIEIRSAGRSFGIDISPETGLVTVAAL